MAMVHGIIINTLPSPGGPPRVPCHRRHQPARHRNNDPPPYPVSVHHGSQTLNSRSFPLHSPLQNWRTNKRWGLH